MSLELPVRAGAAAAAASSPVSRRCDAWKRSSLARAAVSMIRDGRWTVLQWAAFVVYGLSQLPAAAS